MLANTAVLGNHWSPMWPTAGEVAACRIARCAYQPSIPFDSPEARVCTPVAPGLPEPADFSSARLIIWHQPQCIACRNSEDVFRGLGDAARARGLSVHKVEATPELIRRFPHVTVVPLYDLVSPGAPDSCSPYGPGTTLRTIRNDLGALRAEFPTLALTPAAVTR